MKIFQSQRLFQHYCCTLTTFNMFMLYVSYANKWLMGNKYSCWSLAADAKCNWWSPRRYSFYIKECAVKSFSEFSHGAVQYSPTITFAANCQRSALTAGAISAISRVAGTLANYLLLTAVILDYSCSISNMGQGSLCHHDDPSAISRRLSATSRHSRY